jgi:hypothetical protein
MPFTAHPTNNYWQLPMAASQLGAGVGQGLGNLFAQHKQTKEEREGLQTAAELMTKQLAQDPQARETFGEDFLKSPGMSNSQLKSWVASMAGYLGTRVKERERNQTFEIDRMQAGSAVEANRAQAMREQGELNALQSNQQALEQFAAGVQRFRSAPTAALASGVADPRAGLTLSNLSRFAGQNPVGNPIGEQDLMDIAAQSRMMDPKVLAEFAKLTPGYRDKKQGEIIYEDIHGYDTPFINEPSSGRLIQVREKTDGPVPADFNVPEKLWNAYPGFMPAPTGKAGQMRYIPVPWGEKKPVYPFGTNAPASLVPTNIPADRPWYQFWGSRTNQTPSAVTATPTTTERGSSTVGQDMAAFAIRLKTLHPDWPRDKVIAETRKQFSP